MEVRSPAQAVHRWRQGPAERLTLSCTVTVTVTVPVAALSFTRV